MLVAASKMRMFLNSPAWRNWQTRWTQNPVIARSCGFEPLRRQSFLEHCALDLAYSTFDDTQFFRFTLLASSMHVKFCLYVYQIAAAWFCGARSFCCDCLGWAISYSGRRERCKRASDKGCRRAN